MIHYRLLLICLLFCFSPVQSLQSEAVYPENYWAQQEEDPSNYKLKKKPISSPPLDPSKQLSFLKIALYLSLGVGLILLFSFSIPIIFNTVLLQSSIILAGFFWFLGGILAMLAVIMVLANSATFDFVHNQQIAAYLFGLLLLRIVIIIGIGFLIAEAGIIAILLISAMPAFIAYIIGIRRSLKYHRSNKEAKKFWKK